MKKQSAGPAIAPFELRWLDSRPLSNYWDNENIQALEYLCLHGADRDRQAAQEQLPITHGKQAASIDGSQKSRIRWGAPISLSDGWIAELAVGDLRLHVVWYGDSIHLSEKLQGLLNVGCSTERNQCEFIALAAAAEWVSRNSPNRAHCANRVDFLESQILRGGIRDIR